MRPHLPTLIAAVAFPCGAAALQPVVEVGVGLPELTHVRLGAFVSPRVAAQLYVSNVIFNWLTGVSVAGHILGEARPNGPPRHAVLALGTLAFNPLADPIRIRGGGETIVAAALLDAGYALTTDSGFTFHATVGVIAYVEDTLAAGPNFSLSVGWKF